MGSEARGTPEGPSRSRGNPRSGEARRADRHAYMREALREHNREALEMWLVTRAHRLSTRPPAHPDEFHGRVGKPKSTPNQDLTWLDAISSPDARSADAFFRRVVEGELPESDADAYVVLWRVYLSPGADESLPEHWRRGAERGDYPGARRAAYLELRGLLARAIAFVLDRAEEERRVLYWPSPEEAEGYVEEQAKKRRLARQAYFSARREGARPGEAIRAAVRESRASRAAVYYWVTTRRKKEESKE